jgi:hypothetical protein
LENILVNGDEELELDEDEEELEDNGDDDVVGLLVYFVARKLDAFSDGS